MSTPTKPNIFFQLEGNIIVAYFNVEVATLTEPMEKQEFQGGSITRELFELVELLLEKR